MRLLKKKIAASLKCHLAAKMNIPPSSLKLLKKKIKKEAFNIAFQSKAADLHGSKILEKYLHTLHFKNIWKNYGRAMCNFCLSDISMDYIMNSKEAEVVDLQ